MSARYKVLLWVTSVVFVVDRVTKELARAFLAHNKGEEAIRVIKGVLYLRWSSNSAGFFGFLDELPEPWRPVLFGLATFVFGGLVIYFVAKSKGLPNEPQALSLVLAGIVGNGFDRLVYGHVIDGVYAVLPWGLWSASFNLADLAMFVGIVWTILMHVALRSSVRSRAEDGPADEST
ncbi:MAG: signal peptidase II [Polyangiaceae bacterium]|nr:signal peptidase II [Polyangiaceae bacterium]